MRRALAAVLALLVLTPAAGAATGDLTQLGNPFGCNHFSTADPSCTPTTALHQPEAVAISPDGTSVYAAASYQGEAIVQFARNPATGAMDQPSDPDGCVSETGAGPCRDGERLQFPVGVATSPDGRNVYAAAANSSAVVILDRDPATGMLTQRTGGVLGCVTADGSGGECKAAAGIDSPDDVIVSPDGKTVYAAGENTLVALSRDPATGDLSALPVHGCDVDVNVIAASPCDDARGIWDLRGAAISSDGKTVVTASAGTTEPIDGGMAVFDRDPATGVLTQRAGVGGCFTENGSDGACTNGRAADTAFGVAISPDDESVYLAARTDAILRVRPGGDGAITQKPGTDGCMTDNSFDAANETCALGHSLLSPTDVAVSPDGRSVYMSSQDLGGVDILDRSATGVLTQRPSPAGCVATSATGCGPAHSLEDAVDVVVSPDGRNVYVASHSDAVGVFAREGGDPVLTPSPSPSPAAGATVAPTPSPTPAPIRLPPTYPPPRIRTVSVSVRNGTVSVDGEAPGPGVVTASADGTTTVHISRVRTKRLRIARASRTVAAAGRVKLVLKPKGKAKRLLRRKGRLKATLTLGFTPVEGVAPAATKKKVTFRYKA